VIGTAAATDLAFIKEASGDFGSSTIVVCMDVKRRLFRGPTVRYLNGMKSTDLAPTDYARLMEDSGAGELIVQSIDKDGTMDGYDTDLIREVAAAVSIPVVALGGAGKTEDLREAYRSGASALAAGSLFVYKDKKRGVLINYPAKRELNLG